MMEDGNAGGSKVYPMNEMELQAAGSVVQQLWRLLQQTQVDVRDDPSIQQLLRTALSLLPRVKESAKVRSPLASSLHFLSSPPASLHSFLPALDNAVPNSLLSHAFSLLYRYPKQVGPFTEMDLLPYAQQYREDYIKTFQIYNDVALMFLVRSLRARYQQLQALHIM
jgi:hypothetical protein